MKSKPARPNPALADLNILVGAWDAEISNARFLPDSSATVRSTISFVWIEGGDFLAMRQGSKPAGPPYATWIIGRDEADENYRVLYFDDRRVSRVYEMSFTSDGWRLWREAPNFSQRFTGKFSRDRTTITASWEMLRDGRTWEHDFDVRYTKKRRRTVG